MNKKPTRALITLSTSKYDLTNVGELIQFLNEVEVRITFPLTISATCCDSELIIRSFDDFPKKSIICKCGTTYLLQLTKE